MDEAPARTRMRAPERREAILRAAREEFARHGFHGAGTAAIARAAGCSEAVIYRHFPSKKALLAAVLEEEVWGGPPGAGQHPLGGDPAEGMAGLFEARLADPDAVTAARMVLVAISLSDDPEIGPTVRRAFGTVRERLRAGIEAAQAGGRMRPDIDPELLTWLWHGLAFVAVVRRTISDDGAATQAVDAARALERLLQPGR